MHSFELQRKIKHFFAERENFQPFIAGLSILVKSAEGMGPHLRGVARGGQGITQSAANLHEHLGQVQKSTSDIINRQFFRALEIFQKSIEQLRANNVSQTSLINDLNSEVEEFATLYDAFLSRKTGEHAVPLILAARDLYAKIETLFDSLQLVEEAIGAYDVPGSSEAPLALLLPAHLDLAEFARKLLALQALYSELCMLLSVSENAHPLRISKIESGSLWAKVFGQSRVIGLMASFVEQTASWLYRSYTTEGKIASVPQKVESIDALLNLTERLAAAGIDTSEMKEHIGKSAVAISKSLAEIMDGQPSVTVNEMTLSVGSELNKKFLEQTVPRRLKNQDSTASDAPPPMLPAE